MKIKIHRVSLGLLALMTLGGCASFNDCYYEKTQRLRASKEYVHCGKPECSEYPHDYKKGWIDGFYEVATGGSDCPPAVAPAKYYEPKEILKYRDKKRHDYYSGWQDGAARASQFPNTHYLRIYETEDCPFPRCDNPCSDGQCGPCGEAFVGMSAATEMIEGSATTVLPKTDVEEEQSASATIQNVAAQPEQEIELTIPQLGQSEVTPIEKAVQAVSVPVPAAKPKPALDLLTDIPTLPLLPAANIASVPVEPALSGADVAETHSKPVVKAEQTPLVSIPGYRTTTQWSRPAARKVNAQPAGFIRLIEPIRDAQSTQSSNGVEPIVIVEAPYQHFQMSDADAEAKPVIKLVE